MEPEGWLRHYYSLIPLLLNVKEDRKAGQKQRRKEEEIIIKKETAEEIKKKNKRRKQEKAELTFWRLTTHIWVVPHR